MCKLRNIEEIFTTDKLGGKLLITDVSRLTQFGVVLLSLLYIVYILSGYKPEFGPAISTNQSGKRLSSTKAALTRLPLMFLLAEKPRARRRVSLSLTPSSIVPLDHFFHFPRWVYQSTSSVNYLHRYLLPSVTVMCVCYPFVFAVPIIFCSSLLKLVCNFPVAISLDNSPTDTTHCSSPFFL